MSRVCMAFQESYDIVQVGLITGTASFVIGSFIFWAMRRNSDKALARVEQAFQESEERMGDLIEDLYKRQC